ncbi:hypothetical protein A1D22_01840 [Pasteurellaceae bacterium LFhippo2]|nr:hypothetical protein [Pasteurellaceae bacterium LFhippo2]
MLKKCMFIGAALVLVGCTPNLNSGPSQAVKNLSDEQIIRFAGSLEALHSCVTKGNTKTLSQEENSLWLDTVFILANSHLGDVAARDVMSHKPSKDYVGRKVDSFFSSGRVNPPYFNKKECANFMKDFNAQIKKQRANKM